MIHSWYCSTVFLIGCKGMGWCWEWQKKESKSSKKMRVDEADEFLIINLAKDEEYLHRDSLLLK
jgi:hypothetical protein